MSERVEYLVRSLGEPIGLIYPTELENRGNYDTRGSFYLMGRPGSFMENRYRFWAVLNNELIETQLVAEERNPAFFIVVVAEVGTFRFHAEGIREREYVGTNRFLRGQVSLRRLRAHRLKQLEAAVMEHNFYFVGFSPQILAEKERIRR